MWLDIQICEVRTAVAISEEVLGGEHTWNGGSESSILPPGNAQAGKERQSQEDQILVVCSLSF